MSYPAAIYTGNRVIAASMAFFEAAVHRSHNPDSIESEHQLLVTYAEFLGACEAHKRAAAAPHVQGPDIDAT